MSSLRAIEPMALPGVEPGPVAGAVPRLEWGDPKTLWVDETYQRNLSERLVKLIRKIVAEFDWRRFSPPKVVHVDGRRHVLDGQHTAIAAASHPGIKEIPWIVLDAPELLDRARAFIGHNRDRVPLPTRAAGRKAKLTHDDVERLFKAGRSDEEIARQFGCSIGLVRIRRLERGLKRPTGAKAHVAARPAPPKVPKKAKARLSRFESKPATAAQATMPPVDHAALTEARTIYPSTVTSPRGLPNLLVSGKNHWKIGERIIKGKWAGFLVYTLTLEERATCPTSCRHWRSCYGNHIHLANRVKHGADLEARLAAEVAVLAFRHPGGFAVRLHSLGDFYSVAYVRLWRDLIERHPELHVFGFSARWQADRDPIADELLALIAARWERFAVRISNAPVEECATLTVEHPLQVPDGTILCPQQVGKTESCGTCGLCWATTRRIAFLQH